MGYAELLRALEAEVERQVRVAGEDARAERERLLAEARATVERERDAALAAEQPALEAARRRVLDAASLAAERRVLVERRRWLDALRAEAAALVADRADAACTALLADEILREAGGEPGVGGVGGVGGEHGEHGRIELRVPPQHAAALRAHVARAHAALAGRLAVVEAGPGAAGPVAVVGARLVLDNSPASRLAKAWPLLEGGLAHLLFEEPAEALDGAA